VNGWNVVRAGEENPKDARSQTIEGQTLLILSADRAGEEHAGKVAAQSGATLLGRIEKFDFEGDVLIARRAAYGGRIELETSISVGPCIATMRDPSLTEGTCSVDFGEALQILRTPLPARLTALEGARIIVSGGRGVDADGFAALEQIATKLGAALGASLPAVDLGLAPVSRQIGQSGKFVTPDIYLAAGLSGTPQHLAGVGALSCIVAINTDAEAPIFSFAEVGVLGDVREILPKIVEALISSK
jgi:electron transfer flavoprotein alpha subunit